MDDSLIGRKVSSMEIMFADGSFGMEVEIEIEL